MNIAYALAGEGRGHTTRAIGLADRLIEAGHRVQFFTCGDAVDLLEKRYGANSVTYLETPRFVLGKRGISYIGTAYALLSSSKAIVTELRIVSSSYNTISPML